MNNQGTVCAVVVTYNRKDLLLECLEALKKQSKPLNAIYIIDNDSTDGTPQLLMDKKYIKELAPENLNDNWENEFKIKNLTNEYKIKIHYVRMHENSGGAGGFHEGVKRAYESGYDWLWLMDDDTVANNDSLEILFNKMNLVEEKVGFACSKVLWNDKSPHYMNLPQIQPLTNETPFNKYGKDGIYIVKTASFVSLLLSRSIITEFGLPLKEFFIWGDDMEYSGRITNKEYLGIYVNESIVYHKTKENYCTNILSDKIENIWKYFYAIRNDLYILRNESFLKFVIYVFYNIIFGNINILRNRNDNKSKFIWINTKASLASIVFNPKIELVV